MSPRPLTIRHRFEKSRFGWHVQTTHGIFIVEGAIFSWTLKGAERKADRLAARLRDRDGAVTFEHCA